MPTSQWSAGLERVNKEIALEFGTNLSLANIELKENDLLILAVSSGRVDVQGRGVKAADVGRTFSRSVDHIQLGE